jgi:hypothetical protein
MTPIQRKTRHGDSTGVDDFQTENRTQERCLAGPRRGIEKKPGTCHHKKRKIIEQPPPSPGKGKIMNM